MRLAMILLEAVSLPVFPRARFVDTAKTGPSEQAGWKFNDLIRVPSAG